MARRSSDLGAPALRASAPLNVPTVREEMG